MSSLALIANRMGTASKCLLLSGFWTRLVAVLHLLPSCGSDDRVCLKQTEAFRCSGNQPVSEEKDRLTCCVLKHEIQQIDHQPDSITCTRVDGLYEAVHMESFILQTTGRLWLVCS